MTIMPPTTRPTTEETLRARIAELEAENKLLWEYAEAVQDWLTKSIGALHGAIGQVAAVEKRAPAEILSKIVEMRKDKEK